jgi:DNA repair photolyase
MSKGEARPVITEPVYSDQNAANLSSFFMPQTYNNGCPVGGRYCYIANVGTAVEPKTPADIDADIQTVTGHPKYSDGSTGSLIRLGCETDPFLLENVPNTIRLLQAFQELGNPIEIATKLEIPEDLLTCVHEWLISSVPPVLFTSIVATTSLAQTLELHAPSPEKRARNFRLLADTPWRTGMMIKPFLPNVDAADTLAEIAIEYQPEFIVVGALYRRVKNPGSGTKLHPLGSKKEGRDWARQELSEAGVAFSASLAKRTGLPVFESSTQVIRRVVAEFMLPIN